MRDIKESVEFEAFFVSVSAFAAAGIIALTLAVFAVDRYWQQPVSSFFSPSDEYRLSITEQTVGEQKRAWLKAMDQLILHANKEADIANVGYKYDACFLKNDECEINTTSFWDEFNKVTFYYTPSYHAEQKNHASFYLLLKEGQMPYVMMRLAYVGKEWVYIEGASILVNGEFIFKEEIPEVRTQRKAVTGSLVYELSDLPVNEKMTMVRKIADAQTIAVRFEGGANSVALDSEALSNFKQQAREILSMYEMTVQALEDEGVSAASL